MLQALMLQALIPYPGILLIHSYTGYLVAALLDLSVNIWNDGTIWNDILITG